MSLNCLWQSDPVGLSLRLEVAGGTWISELEEELKGLEMLVRQGGCPARRFVDPSPPASPQQYFVKDTVRNTHWTRGTGLQPSVGCATGAFPLKPRRSALTCPDTMCM